MHGGRGLHIFKVYIVGGLRDDLLIIYIRLP